MLNKFKYFSLEQRILTMKNLKPYSVIFLLSLSALSFEIILARIFSYVLAYHFVFIIIAFAILALALGQLYASRLAAKNSLSYNKYFIVLQLLFPLSLAAIFTRLVWGKMLNGVCSIMFFMMFLITNTTFTI